MVWTKSVMSWIAGCHSPFRIELWQGMPPLQPCGAEHEVPQLFETLDSEFQTLSVDYWQFLVALSLCAWDPWFSQNQICFVLWFLLVLLGSLHQQSKPGLPSALIQDRLTFQKSSCHFLQLERGHLTKQFDCGGQQQQFHMQVLLSCTLENTILLKDTSLVPRYESGLHRHWLCTDPHRS